MPTESAVVFLVFNRPDVTRRTFAEIRRARPKQLLVIADGPRPSRPDDLQACVQTREIIDNGVDWPCQIKKNYSDVNLGCAERVSSGLSWAFTEVEHAIIIEDDCLVDPAFFPFCEEMLARYRHDERIGQICGSPLVEPTIERCTSYIFSRYGPIWGWASWRRAWQYYDLQLKNWPRLRVSNDLSSVIHSRKELQWRTSLYESLYSGPPHTWDYQWGYAKLTQSMLSVIPCQNLVQNIGFGEGATHTSGRRRSGLPFGRFGFPLTHPELILPDSKFDSHFSLVCSGGKWRSLLNRFRSKLTILFDHYRE